MDFRYQGLYEVAATYAAGGAQRVFAGAGEFDVAEPQSAATGRVIVVATHDIARELGLRRRMDLEAAQDTEHGYLDAVAESAKGKKKKKATDESGD